MASVRPSLFAAGAACSRPMAQLERRLARLQVGAVHPAMQRRGSGAPARHSSTTTTTRAADSERRRADSLTAEQLGLPADIASDAVAFDELLQQTQGGSASSGGGDDEGGGFGISRSLLPLAGQQGGETPGDGGKMPFVPRLTGFARAVPASPSYFTRQPHFNDRFLHLQELFRRYGQLPLRPSDQVDRVAWKTLADYQADTGERIKAPQYNKCLAIVKHLHKIHPALKPPALAAVLDDFLRDVNPFGNVTKPLAIDRFGRAVGVGRRKTSVARAWVVEGTGEVLVNGKTLSAAFGRVHDRESATWALRATDRTDKYNVWALVDGGGTTGQAEALTLAVAKGLVAHEPALKTALRKEWWSARSLAT